MRDFRLPPWCRWDLRSSGILRSVEWQFCTDVSRQPIGPIFKGQDVQEESFILGLLQPWSWNRLGVPSRRYRIITLRCVISQKSADLIVSRFMLPYLRCSSGPEMQMLLCYMSHISQMFVQQIALLTLLMKCFWAGVMVHVNWGSKHVCPRLRLLACCILAIT